MSAMERATSVDDLLGGFFRSVQAGATGIGRTDSEAAFQEFLKRIPSTTNLAAAAAAGQLDSSVQAQALLSSGAAAAAAAAGAGTTGPSMANGTSGGPTTTSSAGAPSLPTAQALSTAPPELPSGLGGIPRVPSLEFLRQLYPGSGLVSAGAAGPGSAAAPVTASGAAAPAAAVKVEPAAVASAALTMPLVDGVVPKALPIPGVAPPYAGLPVSNALVGLPGLTPSDLASLSAVGTNLSAALQAVPGFNSAAVAGNPLAAAALNPAAAAAAALQLGQLGQLGRLTAASNGALPDKESLEKAEVRRARRMLSNRESARRSRKRKQEHLSKLETEVSAVVEEKRSLQEIAEHNQRRAQFLEEENKRLKEENERLRDELKFLRTEITERKERNGYYRREQESDEEHQPVKRHREQKGVAAKDDTKKDNS